MKQFSLLYTIVLWATILLLFFFVVTIIVTMKRKERRQKELYLKILLEDRERIFQQFADELHDNISNMLVKAKLMLNEIESKSAGNNLLAFKSLDTLLERLHMDTHHAGRALGSRYITQIGIIEIMEQDLTWLKNTKQIHTEFKVHGFVMRIPDLQKVMIYRIFQEAVMNVVKYAKASHLWVKIAYNKNGSFHLKIADNGIGFELEQSDFKSGVGIKSMQERAFFLKGKLSIYSRLRIGTYISLSIVRLFDK